MTTLVHADADEIAAKLPYESLIPALREAFKTPVDSPKREHHALTRDADDQAELLIMPAWDEQFLGVKLVTLFPDNARMGRPTLDGLYVLFDIETGRPVMTVDGAELTDRRAAAVSAIASECLSRPDSETLLIVGAGRKFRHMVAAHAAVRPIKRVIVWARERAKAEAAIARVCPKLASRLTFEIAARIEDAVKAADIISTATHSTVPLIAGAWLKPGTHLDLVGAYRPDMREADTTCFEVASVYVDTREGVLSEDGDTIEALAKGAIEKTDIRAELVDLVGRADPAREVASEITLFKAVGAAYQDLALVKMLYALKS